MKKMKKNLIRIILFVLILSMIFAFNYQSLGTALSGITASTAVSNANDSSSASSSMQKIMGAVAVVFKAAGVGLGLVMLISLGIKYMYAAPGEKADIKKSAVIYVVGAIVLFAAGQILSIIENFSSNVSA